MEEETLPLTKEGGFQTAQRLGHARSAHIATARGYLRLLLPRQEHFSSRRVLELGDGHRLRIS